MVTRPDTLGTAPLSVVREPASQTGPHEASEQLAYGVASPTRYSWTTWPALPRSSSHRRHPAPRGRRAGSRRRIDYRAPLAEDAGALLAHQTQCEEGRA